MRRQAGPIPRRHAWIPGCGMTRSRAMAARKSSTGNGISGEAALGSDFGGCYQPETMSGRSGIRIGWLWPACVLAVVLQIMLPLAMVSTLATSVDPLYGVAICHSTTADDASGNSPGAPAEPSHQCICPVCHLGGSNVIALIPGAASIPLLPPLAELSAFDPAQSVGPRGPPLDRPRARSPPSLG